MRPAAILGMVLALCACAAPAPTVSEAQVPGGGGEGMEPQVAASIETARQEVLRDPGSAAWGELGMRLHAHDLFAEAAIAYARAAEQDPEAPRWPYLEAICHATSDLSAALPLLQRAGALGQASAGFHVRHGDALAAAGRPDRAAQQYARALERDPRSTHALLGLALLDLQQGDPEEAVARLEKAAGIAPHHGELYTALARAYRRQGRDDRAEQAALSARVHDTESSAPDPLLQEMHSRAVNSRAWTRRGLALAREGRYAEAEKAFLQVLAIRPPNARDLTNLGGALEHQGKHTEAFARLRQALALNRDDAFAHGNLGLALLESGALAAAEVHLLRAIELDPVYPDGLSSLGLLRERQGRPADARDAYERALASQPGHGTALNNLARLEAARGDNARAEVLWQRAASIDPLNLDARYNLAVLLVQQARHAEAIEILRAASVTAPNSSIIARLLAWELATAPSADLRNGAEAVIVASRVFSRYPEVAEVADLYAAALAEAGRFEEAVTVAEGAIAAVGGGGRVPLAQRIAQRLAGYRAHRPYHQPGR